MWKYKIHFHFRGKEWLGVAGAGIIEVEHQGCTENMRGQETGCMC
jgi:hypothetical protein